MTITRRAFLGTAAAGVCHAYAAPGLRIGVTDWNLRQTGRVEAVTLARQLGFDGVEVSLGRKPSGDRLPMADESIQNAYLAAAGKEKIALAGTCLDILHVNYLKDDRLGQKWVADGIGITKKLNAKVMLLPFFGKGAIEAKTEQDYVGDVLRELAPEAAKSGVLLGLENTISAEANARIMDRTRSEAVKVYYDVGNSTRAGFDPAREIPWLGRDRICQFHLKDNPHYLGQGAIDFPAIAKAIHLIAFRGFANLETASPSSDVAADMRRNLSFVRQIFD